MSTNKDMPFAEQMVIVNKSVTFNFRQQTLNVRTLEAKIHVQKLSQACPVN